MKKDSKNLLWGIVAGSVIGSVTALLFAPKSGKELRKDIADGASATVDKGKELALQVGDKSTELYGKAKDALGNVVHEVRGWGKNQGGADGEEELAVSEETADTAVLKETAEVAAVATEAEAVEAVTADSELDEVDTVEAADEVEAAVDKVSKDEA